MCRPQVSNPKVISRKYRAMRQEVVCAAVTSNVPNVFSNHGNVWRFCTSDGPEVIPHQPLSVVSGRLSHNPSILFGLPRCVLQNASSDILSFANTTNIYLFLSDAGGRGGLPSYQASRRPRARNRAIYTAVGTNRKLKPVRSSNPILLGARSSLLLADSYYT